MDVARLVAGSALWILAAWLLAVPHAALALLAVPLVLVPHRLDRASRFVLSWLTFASAMPLVAAFAIEPGIVAALLAMPWLGACAVLAAPAILHGVRSLPSILRPASAGALLGDASLILLAVGATFAVLDRSAANVLGLDRAIVLITAVHFHVLGFGLISVAAALAGGGEGLAKAAAYPFLAGIPLTAAGFSLGSTTLQWLGSILVVTGGLLVVGALVRSIRHVSSRRRAGALLAAAALVVGLPMGLLWATAVQFGVAFVDFGTMVATHGVLNTIGTTLALFAVHERRQ